MLCFEIRVNGGAPTVAGDPDASVLTAIATYARRRHELDFTVGGLDDRTSHLDWVKVSLSIGDMIEIRVVESDCPSEPLWRHEDPDLVEREKVRYYERLKKEYGE